MSDAPDRFHLAALVHSLGRVAAARELKRWGCPRAAFRQVAQPRLAPAQLMRDCAGTGIEVLTATDERYPPLLREIDDAPLVLYALGNAAAGVRPGVAIVGARRCTRTGAEVAASLGAALARAGACVISGLAHGIDAAAHRAALREGVTAAVVGSGLARPYPAGNASLAQAMLDRGGLLLSEYPPWHGARRHHFPERNRLISGIAMGVVVVEAGLQSGSLITARMAAEQGREVCAVPGPATSPVSRGCHRLLRQGAALVETAADVLEALGLALPAQPRPAEPTPRPADGCLARVLARVEATVTSLDELVASTGLAAAEAAAALVELELSGFVRQVPGGYIRRPHR